MKLEFSNNIKSKKIDTFETTFLILMCLSLVAVFVIALLYLNENDTAMVVNTILPFVSLVFVLILFGFCIGGETWDIKQKRRFEAVVISFYFVVLFFCLSEFFGKFFNNIKFEFCLDNLYYVISSVYWLLFWYFQRDKYSSRFNKQYADVYIITFFSLYSLVAIVNIFTGFCFYYDEDGVLIVKSFLLSLMTLFWFILYLVIVILAKTDKKTKFALASYSFFPMLYMLFLFCFYENQFIRNISTSIGCVFYLISIYLLFFNIYLERGRLLLVKEKELQKSRAEIITLQINPHFIANTMSSIVALCKIDAIKAQDLASKFARYLRDNYVNMSVESQIPITTEMEHVDNYIQVEKVRFPNLNAEYEINCTSFNVPILTVQTLVENAVRHGIQKRSGAKGTVKIKTEERQKDYLITISDDGVGFEQKAVSFSGNHTGVKNVRLRLELLCGGTLHVESKKGSGTICRVSIPKTFNKESE